MKINFWLIIILSLTVESCEKVNDQGPHIYFNSFESKSDTTGWKGGAFNFSNDVTEHGGKRSLYVSGGCIIPHAEYTIPPQNMDSYLILKFWAKNLSNGGGVYLYVNQQGYKEIQVGISETEWTLYQSVDTLFCPANTSLIFGAISGGIMSSAMLIDMVEIRKLNIGP